MDYKPPPGPPPGRSEQQLSSNNPYRVYQSEKEDQYQPSPGPPPSAQYQAPPGPPPGHGQGDEPPAYAPWLAVPDSTFLPPPPGLKEHWSPANNASTEDADAAEAWCRQNGLWGPRTWSSEDLETIQAHHFSLSPPPGTKHLKIEPAGHGRTSLSTKKKQSDLTVLSSLPLLAPQQLHIRPGQSTTIYYEVKIKYTSSPEATVALGFLALPYPPGRLPGWHRGSLAVHNDDGHRFVNDDEGGIEFVRPFGDGDTVGLGMTFTGSQYQGQPHNVRVFFTRSGREEGSWDLHESRDVDSLEGGVIGLDGTTDLYAAIGVCAGVELEVNWIV